MQPEGRPGPEGGATSGETSVKRWAYLALAAFLTAFALFEVVKHGGWTRFALAFFFLPDVALFYGAASGLEHGQLHPRAVHPYNTLHSFIVPVVLLIAGIRLPTVVFASGLAWAAHIALDQGLGFGLRTREGFQRS